MHWYAIALDTATWILCAQLLYVHTPQLHWLTGLHALIVYVFLLHGSWFILLLHGYSCIPVRRLYSGTDIDIPVTGHVSCWNAMCGIPHLLFPFSRYLVLCYQQSSCPIIKLHVPCTVLVLSTLCTLHIINITWEWRRLVGWLDLVGWMSGSIICPTVGDGVVLATVCYSSSAPVFRYVISSLSSHFLLLVSP